MFDKTHDNRAQSCSNTVRRCRHMHSNGFGWPSTVSEKVYPWPEWGLKLLDFTATRQSIYSIRAVGVKFWQFNFAGLQPPNGKTRLTLKWLRFSVKSNVCGSSTLPFGKPRIEKARLTSKWLQFSVKSNVFTAQLCRVETLDWEKLVWFWKLSAKSNVFTIRLCRFETSTGKSLLILKLYSYRYNFFLFFFCYLSPFYSWRIIQPLAKLLPHRFYLFFIVCSVTVHLQ